MDIQQEADSITQNFDTPAYRAHDRRTDKKGRPLKKTDSGKWVIDTPEAEEQRRYALERYYELKRKEEANKDAYEESRKAAIYRADETARTLDVWSTREIAEMFHATTDQVRGWMQRGILGYDQAMPGSRYYATSLQVMTFFYWARQHEQSLMSFSGALFGKLQRQAEKQQG